MRAMWNGPCRPWLPKRREARPDEDDAGRAMGSALGALRACSWAKGPGPMTWLTDGVEVFGPEPDRLGPWLDRVTPAAVAHVDSGDEPRRHGGTWLAGVDALPNDPAGAVSDGPPLACHALDAATAIHSPLPLHPGQVSAVFPGYPGRDPGEGEAAHRYRLRRDAAHLDGLIAHGPGKRRRITEPHAWILGLPVTPMPRGAAPLVVWRGSHEVMRRRLRAVLAPHPPRAWPDLDVTEAYQDARREVFDTCERVEIRAEPGQSILVHRLALHGIAPWTAAPGAAACRIVVYFRPLLPGGVADWLDRP